MSPRTSRSPGGTPESWLAHAESDLALVHLADGHPEVRLELRCFHAQQAVEKALKAVLIARHAEFPLAHDLDLLLSVAEDAGVEVPDTLMEIGRLTPYAVQSRYPGEWEEISEEELAQATWLAEQVVGWAKTFLSVKGPNADG